MVTLQKIICQNNHSYSYVKLFVGTPLEFNSFKPKKISFSRAVHNLISVNGVSEEALRVQGFFFPYHFLIVTFFFRH